MSNVLLFAEQSEGSFKKAVLEAATYGYDMAQKMGAQLEAVVVGAAEDEEIQKLAQYGVSKVYRLSDANSDSFINSAYTAAVSQVAKDTGAKAIIMTETYSGRAVAPRVAVKLDAAPLNSLVSLVDPNSAFDAQRMAFSGKGVQEVQANRDTLVITVKSNGYKVAENPVSLSVEDVAYKGSMGVDAVIKEIIKASDGISLTEADSVVSAGRGMKGPENWAMIEELAELIGAATACSKPTADMGWRPHHEHVGQTGIQISPTLYIAIGISGAIQHLAGVSSSKNIVVINKDPEAPFFKIADYGIVGDLFEVVPKMLDAIKKARVAG
ncbi:MAG: electron transfer flavoprotein subunit alpha/FixB family protein [Bacteroidota bacterium]